MISQKRLGYYIPVSLSKAVTETRCWNNDESKQFVVLTSKTSITRLWDSVSWHFQMNRTCFAATNLGISCFMLLWKLIKRLRTSLGFSSSHIFTSNKCFTGQTLEDCFLASAPRVIYYARPPPP